MPAYQKKLGFTESLLRIRYQFRSYVCRHNGTSKNITLSPELWVMSSIMDDRNSSSPRLRIDVPAYRHSLKNMCRYAGTSTKILLPVSTKGLTSLKGSRRRSESKNESSLNRHKFPLSNFSSEEIVREP